MDSNAIEIKNVTMQFNLERERTDNVKEFFIKKMKRKLQIDSFIALKNVSFKRYLASLGTMEVEKVLR